MSPGGGAAAAVRRVAGLTLVVGLTLGAASSCRSSTAVPDATAGPTTSVGPDAAPRPTPATETTATPDDDATRAVVSLEARATNDGSFRVVERVEFGGPVHHLVLVPPDLSRLSEFERLRPSATDVRLTARDERIQVPGNRVQDRTALVLNRRVGRIELRYTLRRVTVRSRPAPPGRALAVIGPPLTQVSDNSPVQVTVRGDLLNLTCPRLVPEQSCSTGSAPRLRVDRALPRRAAVVKIQLDLPR